MRRRSKELGVLFVLYVAFMLLYVAPSPEAAAHSCTQITNNGTTQGTCALHDPETHVCTTFRVNGTFGVICTDTTE
jgi:hypothetical protein